MFSEDADVMKVSRLYKAMVSVMLLSVAIAGCGPSSQDIEIALDYDDQADMTEVVTHVLAIYEGECDFVYATELMIKTYRIDINVSQRRHIQFFDGNVGDAIGELEPGDYAFVGLGLDDVCLPQFVGCTEKTLGEADEIVIDMLEDYTYTPFCGLMVGCNEGRCPGY